MPDATEMDATMSNSDYRFQSRAKFAWELEPAEEEAMPSRRPRSSMGVWAGLATLTVCLAASLIYGYAILRQESIQIDQIPGIVKSLTPMSQHLANFERRLESSTSTQQRLTSQVQQIDVNSRIAIDATRQQTGQLVAQVRQSLIKEINQRTLALQSQVSTLASERRSEEQLIAEMKEQLVQARLEMGKTQKDAAAELAALRERAGEDHHALTALASALPTRHVNFAVEKNQKSTLIPGVSFQLIKTDVRHQRFDGLIESAMGEQAISVQSQGVRNPVMFYSGDNSKGYLLVVTRVDDTQAYGYLLAPAAKTLDATALSASDEHLKPVSESSR